MAAQRINECTITLFAQSFCESPLSCVDQHMLRLLLELRWEPLCFIEQRLLGYTCFTDPDNPVNYHNVADLPATVSRVMRSWYKFGELHRGGDKPAIESGFITVWYKRGKRHRDNGFPAVISSRLGCIELEYWVEGKQVSAESAAKLVH